MNWSRFLRYLSPCFLYSLVIAPVSKAQNVEFLDSIGLQQRMLRFKSQFVSSRNLDILLPVDYFQSGKAYPVLYWMDGQNAFDDKVAYQSESLHFDQIVDKLIRDSVVRPFILVGVWNSEKRYREFNPSKAFEKLNSITKAAIKAEYGGKPLSDKYLSFLISELKPYIDRNFRTLSGAESTTVGGASMGALISFYALLEHPEVFGNAICMSTHWPLSRIKDCNACSDGFVKYLSTVDDAALKDKRIYFDYGTENLDSWYEPAQQKIDKVLDERKLSVQLTTVSHKWQGASHSHADWSHRLSSPLEFIFGLHSDESKADR